MANALYDKGRESFLKGEISWSGDNVKTALVDTATYTPDLANDQFLSDIPAGERVATSANLSSKTTTAGVADAADITFTAVSGDQSEALVIYQDTGTPSSSRLIAYIDTATGLPVTPNGGDITVTWDSGVSRIFKL
jgi:hypothetical protein